MVEFPHDDALRRAVRSTRAALAGAHPDDLDRSTPCGSWTVRDVVTHLIGSARWYTLCAQRGEAPAAAVAPNVADGDLLAEYARASDDVVAAFSAAGALDVDVVMPTGPMPSRGVMMFAALDTFTHGWDIARATRQSTDLDPVLAEQLLAFAERAVGDALRGSDGAAPFAPARAAKASAPRADHLAAFLGRRV